MKYYVNDNCISCGVCYGACPNVFFVRDDDGRAEAIEEDVKPEDVVSAKEAMNNCPVGAILKIEE